MLAKLSRLQERVLCDRMRLAECQRACDAEEAYALSLRDELEQAEESLSQRQEALAACEESVSSCEARMA